MGRRHDEYSAQRSPLTELGKNEASFDRLAEADLIGDKEPVASRFEELQHGLELICKKPSTGGLERVDLRSERSAEPEMAKKLGESLAAAEEATGYEVLDGLERAAIRFEI